MSRATDSGKCSALVDYARPSVSDNCAGVMSLRGSSQQTTTFPQGTATESWLALDLSGNIARCSFDITVFDNERPSIGKGLNT